MLAKDHDGRVKTNLSMTEALKTLYQLSMEVGTMDSAIMTASWAPGIWF